MDQNNIFRARYIPFVGDVIRPLEGAWWTGGGCDEAVVKSFDIDDAYIRPMTCLSIHILRGTHPCKTPTIAYNVQFLRQATMEELLEAGLDVSTVLARREKHLADNDCTARIRKYHPLVGHVVRFVGESNPKADRILVDVHPFTHPYFSYPGDVRGVCLASSGVGSWQAEKCVFVRIAKPWEIGMAREIARPSKPKEENKPKEEKYVPQFGDIVLPACRTEEFFYYGLDSSKHPFPHRGAWVADGVLDGWSLDIPFTFVRKAALCKDTKDTTEDPRLRKEWETKMGWGPKTPKILLPLGYHPTFDVETRIECGLTLAHNTSTGEPILRWTARDGTCWERGFDGKNHGGFGSLFWVADNEMSVYPHSTQDHLSTLGRITRALLTGCHPANVGMVRVVST